MARTYGTREGEDGGGYSDWYLPSKEELSLLYVQEDVVSGFGAVNFWSSSESSAFNAWYQNFSSGYQGFNLKYYVLRVRPVRAF